MKFRHPRTTHIYTLSLHDALPIWSAHEIVTILSKQGLSTSHLIPHAAQRVVREKFDHIARRKKLITKCQLIRVAWRRSEEHTSELQSQSKLVCRLLLEKKKY